MSKWTGPSPSDFDRWEQLLAGGMEPSQAAKEVGHTCSAFKRANPAEHAALLQFSREVRGYVADRLVEDDVVERDEHGTPLRYKAEASDSMKQFHARRWQPAYGQQQVTLGGTLELDTGVDEAIERFTAAVAAASLRAVAAGGAGGPLGVVDGGGKGAAGLPVGRVDREAEPGRAAG